MINIYTKEDKKRTKQSLAGKTLWSAFFAAGVFLPFLYLRFISGADLHISWKIYLLAGVCWILVVFFSVVKGCFHIRSVCMACYILWILAFLWAVQNGAESGGGIFLGAAVFTILSGIRGTSRKSKVSTGAGILVLFAAAGLFVFSQQERLYQAVYGAEGSIYWFLRQISGSGDEAISGGRINRGNNYRTGTVQLLLEASRQPEETLYLKGFTGGDYTGNNWEWADDEAVFEETAEMLGWQEWLGMIRGMYYSMYFQLNEHTQSETVPETTTLNVRHASGTYREFYMPYYGQWIRMEQRGEGYSYQYYAQQDMQIDWEKISTLGEAKEWYRELQEAYMDVMQDVYTKVPAETLPRLTQLVQENPQQGLEAITAFIIDTLNNKASYTLTPGRAPMNQDIVEYFLFENGQGYCQQFAAAATLMYRLYGIPARYVSGYSVAPSAFERQEDGIWTAQVTDESAHAWVEIFLEDYGWTPVEVTPSASAVLENVYPGFDMTILQMFTGETDRDTENTKTAESTKEAEQNLGQGEGETERNDGKSFASFPESGTWILPVILIYTICLSPVLLDYRRLKRIQKWERQGVRVLFAKWIQMLQFAGYMTGFDGTEDDFAERLSECVTVISRKEAETTVEIVNRAAYSETLPKESETAFVRAVYLHSADFIYKRLKWYQKFLFRYWKNYG